MFLGLIAIPIYFSCGGNNGGGETNIEHEPTQAETTTKPEQVNVVIDKSASMMGYFNAGSMGPLLKTIPEIVHFGDRDGTVRFFGGQILENYASSLKNAKDFNKDTDMKSIIENVLKEAGKMPVAFITDGIVSSKGGIDDIPQMMEEIKNLLEKNDSVASVIYRIESPYKGQYWIEKSRLNPPYHSKSISVEARPFYVILMGPKENIRYFNMNCPIEESYESLSFNIHDNHENLEMYSSDLTVFSDEGDNGYVKKDTRESYELGFAFPSCLRYRIKKLGPDNASLVLNGDTLKRWDVTVKSGTDNNAILTIPNKGPHDSQPFDEAAGLADSCLLELRFDTPYISQWYVYHSDDDSKIATNNDEQSKTFGLKHLIEAFDKAQKNKDVKVTFKFTDE